MKFGHEETTGLDGIDLSLPPDHPDTATNLSKYRTSDGARIYSGCAKWNRKEWVGSVYPEGMKEKDFLAHYVKQFNAVECNTTFYSWKRNTVPEWLEKAEGDFKYCPKFSRTISHFKRLKDVEGLTDYYLDLCGQLGDHFGIAFLQMPDNFTPKKFDDLKNYLEALPTDFPLAVELRHTDWFNDTGVADETFNMLAELNKTMIITDTAGRRDVVHQRLTNDTAFIRFNGYDLHPTDYSRMDAWVDRIKTWIELGLRKVYFFPHQADENFTPPCVEYFLKKVNETMGMELKLPKMADG